MRKIFVASLLATALAAPASAALLFDLSPNNDTTFRPADFGPGQGVSVTTSTNITNFEMFLAAPTGANVKFMLWNGSNSSLLQSSVVAVGAGTTQSWVNSGTFNYTLTAGSTYYFGVIGDNNINVGFIFPTFPYTSNGLTALTGGNSNYDGFAEPVLGNTGLAQIGLRIYGEASGAVPEPASWAMLIAGFGLTGAAMRRRRAITA